MLRSFIKKNQREGMNMETILFSKTDKIKIVTFAAVAFGLPWLLLPQIRVEGILAYNIPASYMMILPTFGIILGRIICERKIHGWFHWIYTIAFIESTAVMVLCAAKVITGKAADDMLTVSSMALSIVLLLGRMIDEQELYPFKDLKKAIGIHIMFVAIAQISNLPQLIHAGALRTADEIVSNLLFAPIDIFVVQSIYFFGEEYAWRGCLQGWLQNIFGKRMGVILLGIIWELWHMPLWFQISEPGQGKLIVLLVLMRMPYVIALAVFLGWAYMKTNNIWLCVLIHGVNNAAGAAFDSDLVTVADTVESVSVFDGIMTAVAVIVMLLFLFTKEYRKGERV